MAHSFSTSSPLQTVRSFDLLSPALKLYVCTLNDAPFHIHLRNFVTPPRPNATPFSQHTERGIHFYPESFANLLEAVDFIATTVVTGPFPRDYSLAGDIQVIVRKALSDPEETQVLFTQGRVSKRNYAKFVVLSVAEFSEFQRRLPEVRDLIFPPTASKENEKENNNDDLPAPSTSENQTPTNEGKAKLLARRLTFSSEANISLPLKKRPKRTTCVPCLHPLNSNQLSQKYHTCHFDADNEEEETEQPREKKKKEEEEEKPPAPEVLIISSDDDELFLNASQMY